MCEFRLVFALTHQFTKDAVQNPFTYRTTFGTMQELSLWIFCPRASPKAGHCC